MPYNNSRISEYLENSELTLKNARKDQFISQCLATYKISDEKYDEGLQLCTDAYDLQKEQIKLHGEQFRAKQKFEKLLAETHSLYMEHVKFMRLAHRDDLKKLNELDAAGIRDKTITGWLTQTKTFYTNTINDEEVLLKMNEYGITKENLQAVELKVLEVTSANQDHKDRKGAAQDATTRRDKALEKLEDFMGNFIAVCRIALKEHPQLLEKLGIVVYTKGYISAKSQAAAEERKKKKLQKQLETQAIPVAAVQPSQETNEYVE